MLNFTRSLWLIINYKTLIITVLSVAATAICHYFNFVGDLPITLIGTAIIFPVVFSINSAYKRREEAIMYYASLKANLISLFYAGKNWVDRDFDAYKNNIVVHIQAIMYQLELLFMRDTGNRMNYEGKIYKHFDAISLFIQSLRRANVSAGELSRIDQYFTKSVTDFEKLKQILYYRTPNSLRTYSVFFLYSFPIIYAPYFAFHLKDGSSTIIGYISAILYSFVFVSLVNIQEQLENPFDQFGEDDIVFDSDELKAIFENEFESTEKFKQRIYSM